MDETDRLSGLVNSVMELSKYSSGTEKLNPVQFDLAQLCDEVAYRYQNICEQSGYTLTVDAADPCTVWCTICWRTPSIISGRTAVWRCA